MKTVFAGTPPFALPALEALIQGGFAVQAVLTQPDRPAGRGRKVTPSPVKAHACALGLPVYTPADGAGAEAVVRSLEPDVVIVVAYGMLLPPALLAIPRYGALNIHASLLPRWRGAAPIARAIEAGDSETGITIIRLDAGLDTGPMLARAATPIGQDETAEALTARLAHLGAQTLMPVLEALGHGHPVTAVPQPPVGASYARKLRKEEGVVDWQRDAALLERQIRAFTPWPGLRASIGGVDVKIGAARVGGARCPASPGVVLEAGPDLVIATGHGALVPTLLQVAGGRMQPSQAFLQAHPLKVGDRVA
ncbi:methionyl-tRNA formyltransferase [Acidiferrobacter sp.]|uniref:methionyl-tRNA formyltransferase n=1 Tax=Acidiferrobacter sp. TaxID=1872107 RepID=UPI00262E9751|nr:methionyl-tRNA formyltransferase [Acidiferrobacter sp.]